MSIAHPLPFRTRLARQLGAWWSALRPPVLLVKLLHPDAKVPCRAKAGDAGYDLVSVESTRIYALGRATVRTGVAMTVPPGHVGLICGRSGLASQNGIDVLGGVVDQGYTGEVKVTVFNSDVNAAFDVAAGVKIAQILLVKIATPKTKVVQTLGWSDRGAAGHGSTGLFAQP